MNAMLKVLELRLLPVATAPRFDTGTCKVSS